MKGNRNTAKYGAVMLILSFSFIAGCGLIIGQSKETAYVNVTQTELNGPEAFSTDEWKSISNGGTVRLTDDSPASLWWTPKSQDATISKIITWLRQAKPYDGKIPSSQAMSDEISFAYIGPSILYINTSDKHNIAIEPVWYYTTDETGRKIGYLADVLKLIDDKQEIYFQSGQLYGWLKNDQWRAEFEEMQEPAQ